MTLRLRSLLIAILLTCLTWGGLWPAPTAWGLGFGAFHSTSQTSDQAMDTSLIPPTSMFVPRQAPLTVSLLTSDLSELQSRLATAGRRADWEGFQNSFLTEADFSYGRDVRPWLGDDLTLAVTTIDLDRQASNGQQPGYLLAVAVKDAELAREFLQRYWQRRAADGSQLHYEKVSGVRLIYSEPAGPAFSQALQQATDLEIAGLGPDKSSNLAAVDFSDPGIVATTSALVGDRFLLFANAPKVMRDAVANVQFPALNLASDSDYQRSLEALTAPRLAYLYANLDAFGGWLETQGLAVRRLSNHGTAQRPAELSSAPSSSIRYRSLAVGLGTTARGLLADTALLSSPQSTTQADITQVGTVQASTAQAGTVQAGTAQTDTTSAANASISDSTSDAALQPARVLDYLPADSIAAVSSAHLDQLWQDLHPLLTAYPPLQTLVSRALDHIQANWKLDIAREIFPWVDGEYGLGQLERPNGTDWVFVVERTSKAAQAGIQHLDNLARQQGYSIGEVALAGREVTAWTSLNPAGEQDSAASAVRAIVRGVHAQMDRYELFSTSLEAMEKVLQSQEGSALTETSQFKQAIAPLPATNQGYLYVNWQDNQELLETQLPLLRILELAAQPLFRGLKTVSLSGYEREPEQGLQRVAIALQLGK